MAKFCVNCGKSLKDEARFCGGCGAPCGDSAPQSAPAPQPPSPASSQTPSVGAPPPPGSSRVESPPPPPGSFGSSTAPPPPGPTVGQNPPPPPGSSGIPNQGFYQQPQASQIGNLTASGRVWAEKLGASAGSQSNLVKRIIRATCLDPETHREVAYNNNLNTEAGIAMAIGIVGMSVGEGLWSVIAGNLNLKWVLAMFALRAASVAALVYAISFLSQTIAGRKADPLTVFRLLAYPMALGVVAVVPVVGQILLLWLLASCTVSLKEITNQDLGKAIILIVVGAIAASIVSAALSPVIYKAVVGTGGYY